MEIFSWVFVLLASHSMTVRVDGELSCSSLQLDGSLLTKQDSVLKGHTRLTLEHVSFIQCSLRCQRHDWCISTNFQISRNTGVCELNDYGVQGEVVAQDLKDTSGFVFTQLRPVKYGCHSNTCSNGATCQLHCASSKITCICPNGFKGDRCEKNIDDCSPNPCQNGATCADGVNSYSCTCLVGYSGPKCQTNIDDCSPNPCQNGGTCADGVNNHTCVCLSGYDGLNCENKPAAVVCDLEWPSQSTLSLVRANWSAPHSISALTVSLWLKVPFSYKKELYPFSYSTKDEVKGLSIEIKEDMKAEVSIMGDSKGGIFTAFTRDGSWQHLCFTWERFNAVDKGTVLVYHNGTNIDNDKDLSKDKSLTSGGMFIVGQRQGSYGGGFDNSKLMVGHISGLNIWSRVLNPSEVRALSGNCSSSQEGDAVAWSDVLASPVQGQVKTRCPSSCPT